MGTVVWVMRSPEVSPSSHDVVIACVVSSQKRGVDMTRGNYVSATIRGIRRPHGQATADNGDFPRSVKRGARPGCPLPFPSLFLHLCASCGERPALRLRAFFTGGGYGARHVQPSVGLSAAYGRIHGGIFHVFCRCVKLKNCPFLIKCIGEGFSFVTNRTIHYESRRPPCLARHPI